MLIGRVAERGLGPIGVLGTWGNMAAEAIKASWTGSRRGSRPLVTGRTGDVAAEVIMLTGRVAERGLRPIGLLGTWGNMAVEAAGITLDV